MTLPFHDPFAVLLLHHPEATASAQALAAALDRWLTAGDPKNLLAPGSNLPTYLFERMLDLAALAASPDTRQAHRLAVILVADDPLVDDDAWRAWATSLLTAPPAFIAPVLCALTPKAAALLPADAPARVDLGPFTQAPISVLADEACLRLTARLLRALPRPPVLGPLGDTLLLSHDRPADPATPQGPADAPRDAGVADHLAAALRRRFDTYDAVDRHFAVLERTPEDRGQTQTDRFRDAVVIALHTDDYSASPRCEEDILTAKALHRPLLVVDALVTGETSQSPHLGNHRTLRWNPPQGPVQDDDPMPRRVLAHALREALVERHGALLLDALRIATRIPAAVTLTRPPDFAALAEVADHDRRRARTAPEIVIYPDPPLGRRALALFRRYLGADFLTLTQAISTSSAAERPLDGLRVALSISESPDLSDFGRTPTHVERAWVALARHLLDAGATLAYGGDLRRGGYTVILAELLRAYAAVDAPVRADAVRSYLPWPAYLAKPSAADLGAERQAEAASGKNPAPARGLRASGFPPGIEAVHCEPPDDAGVDKDEYRPSDTPENRLAWTRALTVMRQRMAQETDARVLLGGQLQSSGNWPGLAEEALEHIRAGKPIYLIGAYGGMTSALIDALEGRANPAFSDEVQLRPKEGEAPGLRSRSREVYDAHARGHGLPLADVAGLWEELGRVGTSGLNNGLSDGENRRLYATPSLFEQVSLVLRGLRGLAIE